MSPLVPRIQRSLVLLLVGLAVGLPRGTAGAQGSDQPPQPTRTERYRAILTEWQAAARDRQQALSAARAAGKTGAELNEIVNAKAPGQGKFIERFLELGQEDPRDPGSRDALIWVASRGGGRLEGSTKTAMDLLLQNYANEPAAIRLALNFSRTASAEHEALVRSFFDRATQREAKGIATLALAQILEKKAAAAAFAAGKKEQATALIQTFDAQEQPKLVDSHRKPFDDAYWQHLQTCDAQALRAEAEALYLRLIDDYADVAYEGPTVRPTGDRVRLPKTLGEVAEAHSNLAVGQPAPAIEGTDLDGQPLKLADYRGKVVLLVFWGSWCGPCLQAVPHERALAERLQGKPFVILGVNCEPNPDDARRAVRDAGITWRSWLDGPQGQGPIASRYLIRGFPAVHLIDARGVIRRKAMGITGLDEAIDALVAESETPPQPQPPGQPER